jgi:hypothetical protein
MLSSDSCKVAAPCCFHPNDEELSLGTPLVAST